MTRAIQFVCFLAVLIATTICLAQESKRYSFVSCSHESLSAIRGGCEVLGSSLTCTVSQPPTTCAAAGNCSNSSGTWLCPAVTGIGGNHAGTYWTSHSLAGPGQAGNDSVGSTGPYHCNYHRLCYCTYNPFTQTHPCIDGPDVAQGSSFTSFFFNGNACTGTSSP